MFSISKSLILQLNIMIYNKILEPGEWRIYKRIAFHQSFTNEADQILTNKGRLRYSFFIRNKKSNEPVRVTKGKLQVLYLSREGSVKGFNIREKKVITKLRKKYIQNGYYTKRNVLKNKLPIIQYIELEDGKKYVEEYQKSKSLNSLNAKEIIPIIEKLYQDAIGRRREMNPNLVVHNACRICIKSMINMKESVDIYKRKENIHIEQDMLSKLDWSFELTHGDLSESNARVDELKQFFVLDVDPRRIALRPYWYDMCYLINRLQKSYGSQLNLESYFHLAFRSQNIFGSREISIFKHYFEWFSQLQSTKYPINCKNVH